MATIESGKQGVGGGGKQSGEVSKGTIQGMIGGGGGVMRAGDGAYCGSVSWSKSHLQPSLPRRC